MGISGKELMARKSKTHQKCNRYYTRILKNIKRLNFNYYTATSNSV